MTLRRVLSLMLCGGLAACAAVTPPGPKTAAPVAATVEWIHPLIDGYGGVHPNAELPIRPEPDIDYKIFVDVVHVNPDHGQLADSLDRLARLVNLMAYAGVPPEHVHIAALLDGGAGLLALTDEAYRKRFKVGNPNLALLHLLKTHGVMLMLCSQAMAEANLSQSDFSPDATVTLSALTDPVVFGQRGYSYVQL